MSGLMARNSSAQGRRGPLRSAALLLGLCLAVASTANTFASPVLLSQEHAVQTQGTFAGRALAHPGSMPAGRSGATTTEAVAAGVGAKVINAMSAGAVAAVVQAMLSSVTEPIVNRVLVKRMAVKDAIAEITPAMVASFFTTTISTNLIKFPLFEAVAMFVSLLPDMNNTVKGLIVGFIFTTATLPITNFRYRMSIQTPVAEAMKPAVLYQAYLPTVIRDMVYAIARGILTAQILMHFAGTSATSASVLFAVVLGSCVISAPFNEIRGYLLQSAGKKMTFREFFKPSNFVRSTSLGALNQAVALATGYYLTPIVAKQLGRLHSALDGGSWTAFFGVVAALDLIFILLSKSNKPGGVVSDRLIKQVDKMEAAMTAKNEQLAKNEEEIKLLKEQGQSLSETKEWIEKVKKEIKDREGAGAMA